MRFLGPHSAGEGPHLVPISLKFGSPSGPHFEKSGSPGLVGTVLYPFPPPPTVPSFDARQQLMHLHQEHQPCRSIPWPDLSPPQHSTICRSAQSGWQAPLHRFLYPTSVCLPAFSCALTWPELGHGPASAHPPTIQSMHQRPTRRGKDINFDSMGPIVPWATPPNSLSIFLACFMYSPGKVEALLSTAFMVARGSRWLGNLIQCKCNKTFTSSKKCHVFAKVDTRFWHKMIILPPFP